MATKTGSSVSAYDHLTDVNVIMSLVHPKPVKGLGNLVILNPVTAKASDQSTSGDGKNNQDTQSTNTTLRTELSDEDRRDGVLSRKQDKDSKAIYVEYRDIDAVAVDYGTDTQIYKKAQTYFAQDNHSDHIAVLTYDPSEESKALEAFWYFGWTFAIKAGFGVDDDAVSLSNIFEANKNRFLVIQDTDEANFNKIGGQNYVIGLVHDTNEAMDAALVGAAATLTVGMTDWKFQQLNGITPDQLTTSELASINHMKAIAYVEVNGTGETSEGWVLSGEYIDTLHGIIWVSTHMENDIENFLQKNKKVSYDTNGITKISGIAIQVLEQATEQGIVLISSKTGKGDYTVIATPREDQPTEDISKRHYGGLSFTYHASGSIHTVTVHGEVDSDTIIQLERKN